MSEHEWHADAERWVDGQGYESIPTVAQYYGEDVEDKREAKR